MTSLRYRDKRLEYVRQYGDYLCDETKVRVSKDVQYADDWMTTQELKRLNAKINLKKIKDLQVGSRLSKCSSNLNAMRRQRTSLGIESVRV